MPAVDIADDTFVARPAEDVAAAVADRRAWRAWWPDLRLEVTRDRGVKGLQWTVRGALAGSMEIWVEPVRGGSVVHWYLRADPPSALASRQAARLRERRVRAWKVAAFALKDGLEGAERVT